MSDDSARLGPLSLTPATEGLTEGAVPPGSETGGSTVPRYRILGLVGIGGMGIVYRAEDTRLGRAVALKFLPPTLIPNPHAKMRFLDEARAASGLDHPNICTIYEIGETPEGQLYLAMAFYEGETLRRRLANGPLPVAEALRIALQVAHGLAKAHQHGIVHRDVKPANLMITKDGIVKILDFGIALLPEQGSSAPLLGTPGYMSPEQERGEAVDARGDVWALGAVLHEMLTGWLPARSGREVGPSQEGPTVPLPSPKELPGINRLLSRMLAEEPADRYPDATALLADLAALERTAADHEEARRPGPARRRIPAKAVLLLLATLTIAAVSWLLWRIHQGAIAPDPSHATFLQLTDLSGKEWFPSLDPDGNFLVYAKKVGDRSRLFLQQVGGGKPLDLLSDSQEDDSQPALSPDGRQIAFRSEREGGGIFRMSLMGESVSRVSELGFNPAWSPNGKEILFATDEVYNPQIRLHSPSKIFRFNLETGQQRLVHTGDADAVQPTWSPHGYRIAYWGISSSGKRVIWTIPAGGGEAVQVTEGEATDWNPVWSPDGRYLYFASDRNGTINLRRVPIDERSGRAGDSEPVPTPAQASMLFSLSRDGKRIAYTTDETRTTLEKVAFDPESGTTSGPVATITRTAQQINSCDSSRDGRWLVYQSIVPQQNLFLIHPDGSGPRQLTADGFKNRLPRWSPDGRRIAYYSNRDDKYEIWLIRVDGSRIDRAAIMPRGSRAMHPIWSPDGRQLACELDENEGLIDLSKPLANRRPMPLPRPGPGLGFAASSWSADGRWLAGAVYVYTPLKRPLPGVVIYSLDDKRYERLTTRGDSATWLSDNRRLLYWDSGRLILLDTRSRASRQVLTTSPGSEYNDFCLSPDNRTLYLARNTEEGDIWLLTMK
jgi:eukaryotic-like serine/threonine-protein kinase